MRDEPRDGESVALVVEPTAEPTDGADGTEDTADADDAVAAAVADLGGTVERPLPFGALLVSIPQEGVGSLCARDDIARIETADTLGYGIDEG